jgi:alpha-ribazole phosphatase
MYKQGAGDISAVRRIWLVRHGLTAWNAQKRYCGHSDIPLAPAGRGQARWLASQLRGVPLRAIYSSDLARARATAEFIARGRPAPVEVAVSGAWREIAFGAWEGLTYAEIAGAFAQRLDFFTDPEHFAPPGGESLSDLLRRVQPALTGILQDSFSGAGDIAIVSHGGTLRGLLCVLLGLPLRQQWQLRLDPGSLSAVDAVFVTGGPPVATLALLNWQRSPGRHAPAIPAAYGASVSMVSSLPVGEPAARSGSDA